MTFIQGCTSSSPRSVHVNVFDILELLLVFRFEQVIDHTGFSDQLGGFVNGGMIPNPLVVRLLLLSMASMFSYFVVLSKFVDRLETNIMLELELGLCAFFWDAFGFNFLVFVDKILTCWNDLYLLQWMASMGLGIISLFLLQICRGNAIFFSLMSDDVIWF